MDTHLRLSVEGAGCSLWSDQGRMFLLIDYPKSWPGVETGEECGIEVATVFFFFFLFSFFLLPGPPSTFHL